MDTRVVEGASGVTAVGGFLGTVALLPDWFGVEASLGIGLGVGVGLGALLLFGIPAAIRYRLKIQQSSDVDPDVQVFLSSTGVIFGDEARLWKSESWLGTRTEAGAGANLFSVFAASAG